MLRPARPAVYWRSTTNRRSGALYVSSSLRAALSPFVRAANAVRDTGDIGAIVDSAVSFAELESLMRS